MKTSWIFWSAAVALMGIMGIYYLRAPTVNSRGHVSERSAHFSQLPEDRRNSTLQGIDTSHYEVQAISLAALQSSDTRLVALTVEEAKWLDAHFFPSQQEISNVSRYSDEYLLRQARDQKDPKAAALLGEKRLKEGNTSGAMSAYELGASLGSLYAREQLAVVTGLRGSEEAGTLNNDTRAIIVAGLEVAKMLGDHRAEQLIQRYGAGLDRQRYGNAIQLQVTEYMRQLGYDFKARGLRPPGPDPRPNADLWGAIDKAAPDEGRPVSIYQR